jgi:DNA invertase Pin-like site-specific DNA recombinase
MADGKFVTYCRVSTQRQGDSGLGLQAQQDAIARYLNGGHWQTVAEFEEVETGKGSNALTKRPQLAAALDACRKHGATLLIAKLDRLARNVSFISSLMEASRGNGKNAVKFVACDLPEANNLTIHIMAAFAEHEAKRISERTKDALAMARRRGVALGKAGAANLQPNIEKRQADADAFAENLRGQIVGFRLRKLSQTKMVKELNQLGIPTPKGRTGAWSLMQVQRVIKRLGVIDAVRPTERN